MPEARPTKRPPAVLSIPDAAWAKAVRRETVIRPLATDDRPGRAAVQVAARQLGLSAPQVYALRRVFRANPVTASLAPSRPGPAKSARRLDPALDRLVEAAIDAVFLQPEKPTLKEVSRRVRQDCRGSGRPAPSTKALRARVTARILRERVVAREGAGVAGDRFRQVKAGPRTDRRLQLVQIDHTEVDLELVDALRRPGAAAGDALGAPGGVPAAARRRAAHGGRARDLRAP